MSLRMNPVEVVTAFASCTLLFMLTKTYTFETSMAIKEVISSRGVSLFQQNVFQETIMQRGLGNGRVLTAEHLQNINIDDETHCSQHKYLVYKCDTSRLCGGLGDREKGIVSAFLLSLLTNRIFIIKLTKPCKLQQFLQPNIYDWYICNNFLGKVRKQNISEFNFIDGPQKLLNQIKDDDLDSKWIKQVIVLHVNTYVMDGIRSHKLAETRLRWLLNTTNEETIHLVLHTLFKPGERILKDSMKFHVTSVRGKHLVCCHIRKGKNPSIPNDNKRKGGTPNESVIFDFLHRFDERHVIYIATDSDNVRKQAGAALDTYTYINRTIVHVDRLGKLKNSGTEACEGFYTALLEQYILSQCDILVLTRSNFGNIAAYIRGLPDNLFLYHQKSNNVLRSNLTDMSNVFKFV